MKLRDFQEMRKIPAINSLILTVNSQSSFLKGKLKNCRRVDPGTLGILTSPLRPAAQAVARFMKLMQAIYKMKISIRPGFIHHGSDLIRQAII